MADLKRPEWNPAYHHRADRHGIGFDRMAAGSDAIGQYAPAVATLFADPRRTPERCPLWFHHLPWDWRLASGETLWTGLVRRYDHGEAEVEAMRATWSILRSHLDAERLAETCAFLAIQARAARWWRDASVAYRQSLNGLPLPPGAAALPHPLSYCESLSFSYAPGH